MGPVPAVAQALAPDWVVNINDTGYDPMPSGGIVVYRVTVENNDLPGNTAPANTITLSIPATATFKGATGTITGCTPVPAVGATTVTCNVPALAGNRSVSMQASVETSLPGTITVGAAVPTLGIDRQPANNIVTQSTTVTEGTNIALTVNGPAVKASGDTADYIFTATNLGPFPATNLKITVPVPPGLLIVPPSGCVLTGPNYVCTIAGPVAVGSSASITFTGQISAGGGSTVTMGGSLTSSSPPDPIPGNNTAFAQTDVTAGSDVKITKSRAPAGNLLLVGDTVTFTLSPSYTGEEPFGLRITDNVPASYEIVSVTPSPGSGWDCGPNGFTGQLVECTLPRGNGPGANVSLGTVTIVATIKSAGQTENIVDIESAGPTDPNLSNNRASDGGVAIQDKVADLRANKSGPANPALVVEGQNYIFNISTTNLGNQPFVGTLVMTDSLPAGLRLTGTTPRGWTCNPGPTVDGPVTITCTREYTSAQPLNVGVTTPPVTLTTLVTATGSITNSMTVSSENANYPDPDLANNTASAGVTSTASGASADLEVIKTAASATIPSGGVQSFPIEIVNRGPSTSTSITLTDDLQQLTNNVIGNGAGDGAISLSTVPGSASALNCAFTPQGGATGTTVRLTCTIPSLPVCVQGADCPVVTVNVRPGGDGGDRTNMARAVSSTVGDPNITNNEGRVTYTVTPDANVQVSKTVTPANPIAGQPFNYIITASNPRDGRSKSENVRITDTLPSGLVFLELVSGSCSTKPAVNALIDSSNNQLICEMGDIADGSQKQVNVRVAPTTALRNTSVTNTVDVESDTPGDVDEPPFTLVTPIANPSLDLQVNKSDNPDPTGINGTMEYTLLVTNNGRSAAENVVVTDTLPANYLEYLSYTAPVDATCTQVPGLRSLGGTLQCSFPLLRAGETRSITLSMEGVARGVAINSVTVASTETALDFDTNILNNTDSESTTVSSRVDVEVASKQASKSPVALFENFTFEIVVRNNTGAGLSDADDVIVSDDLPAGMELTGPPSVAAPPGTITQNSCSGAAGGTAFACGFGTMTLGGQLVITVPVRIVQASTAPQTFTNTASVTTSSLDVDPGNNSNNGNVTVDVASLSGTVFIDLNDNGVQDPGDTGLPGIAMRITGTPANGPPVDVTINTASDGTYSFPNLPPATYQVTRGPVADPVLNNGIVTPGTAGGTVVSPTAIGSITITTQVATGYDFALVPTAALGIDKQRTRFTDNDGNGFVSPGDTLGFTVTATNTGSRPLTDVVVSDPRLDPGSKVCATLAVGDTCVLEGVLTVTLADAQSGEVVNTATADSNETGPVQDTAREPARGVTAGISLTKEALVTTVNRGERVPYVIRALDLPFSPARIVDVMPPGFAYVPGSARANGTGVDPVVDGRNLTFDGLVPDAGDDITLELTLIATTAAATGDNVNQAQLIDPDTGELVATASARVTLLEEAVFDCSDVIGKVFDDKNRNGYQDEGEPGLPGVRLATVKGLLITTDPHGRFSIACADIPDQDIGSNFIVKLDQRTLPTGYRITTENPRRVRLTRGKVVKLNFGAALTRQVSLDLNAKVFEQGSAALKPKWQAGLGRLVTALSAESSTLRITYLGPDGKLAKARLTAVRKDIERRWAEEGKPYDLPIETRVVSTSSEAGQ